MAAPGCITLYGTSRVNRTLDPCLRSAGSGIHRWRYLVPKAWNRTCYLTLTRRLLILMSFIGNVWYFLYESNAGQTVIGRPLYH